MTTIPIRNRADNSGDTSLPLLEYGQRVRVRQLPRAARRLAHRFGLPPSTARTVAEAAGFALEAGR